MLQSKWLLIKLSSKKLKESQSTESALQQEVLLEPVKLTDNPVSTNHTLHSSLSNGKKRS